MTAGKAAMSRDQKDAAVFSHDLARALLARRDNDIQIEVLVDDDPASIRDVTARRVDLRDAQYINPDHRLDAAEVVGYCPDRDVILIRAGVVVVGGEHVEADPGHQR